MLRRDNMKEIDDLNVVPFGNNTYPFSAFKDKEATVVAYKKIFTDGDLSGVFLVFEFDSQHSDKVTIAKFESNTGQVNVARVTNDKRMMIGFDKIMPIKFYFEYRGGFIYAHVDNGCKNKLCIMGVFDNKDGVVFATNLFSKRVDPLVNDTMLKHPNWGEF